ncbi:helix-turn-helix domain-containing protein [Sinorhizobium medicae]|uniref:helix-turn-helix domain-containing protein n=1 Tax=Sinorhizobium medicae TaxID=110321 RepID=UPI001AAF8A16|nr:helix-turn-helix domain-containing protein [Sinorhizobium medicae]MBO1959661.1 helix-turn-helix domain-containing protein [Sinorhizobium medicae]WQP37409.1 helix-turn-helix domain-containing protein [Sinorhizobium medicae]
MSQEATIRRGVRNARYAAIPNHVFEDARLSMEARWLLSYLLSKPDNWTVVIGDIIKKGNCGRDKARKMIAELVDIGYAEREQQREDGKFGASVLVIFDEPRSLAPAGNGRETASVAILPQTALPATALPSPVSPAPVKSAHSNNSDSANTDCQNLREGGREASEDGQEPEDPRKIDAAFWALVKDWPGFAGMPKEPARKAWFALTADERREAAERFARWLQLLRAQKKSYTPAPSTYFEEKLWKDVPAPDEPAKPVNAMAAPFGKLWSAARISELLMAPTGIIAPPTQFQLSLIKQGKTTLDEVRAEQRMRCGWPAVNTMHERARERQGWLCPLALEEVAQGFQPVQRDGEQLAAWRREHQRRGWPFPEGKLPDWSYFPPIEGDGDFDLLVAEAVERFRDQISDYLANRSKGDDHAA